MTASDGVLSDASDVIKSMRYLHRYRFINSAIFMWEPFELQTRALTFDRDVNAVETAGDVTVNFVVALSGRSDNFIRFLHNFESAFLTRGGERVNLIVSYFSSATPSGAAAVGDADEGGESPRGAADEEASNDAKFILENVASVQAEYPENKIEVCELFV